MGYSIEKTPVLIERIKNMISKNMDLIDAPIVGDITEEKYFNVLKGRKIAAEDSIWAMIQIDQLEQAVKMDVKTSCYKTMMPMLISKIKGMFDQNLDIIDTDISKSITEDKYINVLKARRMASEYNQWALKTIDDLEDELNGVDKEQKPKQKSWAKVAAEK